MTATQRVKHLIKKYGWVAVGTHTTVYIGSIGTFYLLIHNGVDVVSIAKSIHLDSIVNLDDLNPAAGEFLVRHRPALSRATWHARGALY